MSAVSSWLLSITGIVMISVLAEFVLPEGQINKYVKVIFAFATLLVIILPLPKIFNKTFDLDKFFHNESVIQEDYIYQRNIDKLDLLSKQISGQIEQEGMLHVDVSINANVFAEKLEIYGIYVDLCDIEYAENFESKDIKTAKAKIVSIISKFKELSNVEVKYDTKI